MYIQKKYEERNVAGDIGISVGILFKKIRHTFISMFCSSGGKLIRAKYPGQNVPEKIQTHFSHPPFHR